MDAETCGLKAALAHPNVELRVGAQAKRILVEPDGKRVRGVEYVKDGETRTLNAKLVAVCAGAVNSAALLLQSREGGLANSSGAVGRHFMNHNASAVLAVDPRTINNSVYQKTLGLNDFYLDDGRGRAARQRPAARPRHRPDPEVQHRERAGMGLECAEPAQRRLVRDERGSAEPGEPRHGRRRTHQARLEAQQLGLASRAGASACASG